MPKRAVDIWEQQRRLRLQQREREMEEFVSGWDWERVYRAWASRIKDFNVVLDPLFLTVNVHDPKYPTGRESQVSWWPANEVHELRAECQRHFNKWPGTGSPHPDSVHLSQGELATVNFLWEHCSDPEKVAAILIAGSIFTRLNSRRARYPENWPPAQGVRLLAQWAREKWQDDFYPWHPSSTDVLPVMSEDYLYKIDAMSGLIRYLAEEHASTLLSYRPIVVEFVAAPDPFVARALEEERAAQQRRAAESAAAWKAHKQAEKEQLEAMRVQHPRWGEFHGLSDDELRRLVWTKPLTQLAAEFGVSDVAIGKRCKARGIARPPRGHWLKTASSAQEQAEGTSDG